MTESMIDCVSLGYLIHNDLDIVGKCVDGGPKTSALPKILEINNRIYVKFVLLR